MCTFFGTNLEHFCDVRILVLHEVSPGGEVAVGEDPARLEQSVRVRLDETELVGVPVLFTQWIRVIQNSCKDGNTF